MTSFWNFIRNHQIEIPIIQRDYAQGRKGKEYLRKTFLANIKQALDNPDTDKALKLDFVYGAEEHDKLHPLDGQQRLTTLWLLHWYIALRAGELNEANGAILRNFTYETRVSSREFCENLCQRQNFDGHNEASSIVSFITNRTWFYSSWKQDPTIQSILRMLGGTKTDSKDAKDIADGIEKLFRENSKEHFKSYWDRLTSENNAPIVFYYQPLKEFGLTDDLYIKMNARGKQLTAFENFKADLIGYMREQKNKKEEWKTLLDAREGIPIKMDTAWTDIFWKNRSKGQTNVGKNGRIDEIYFAFINRYFLNSAIAYANAKEGTEAWKLYGTKSDDSALLYDSGFSIYSGILEANNQTLLNLEKLFDKLKEAPRSINSYLPAWFSKFNFIPTYVKDDRGNLIPINNSSENRTYKTSTLTQAQRVVFFGICRYFEECDSFNEIGFKRWMRVVCNLVENGSVNTTEAMVARIKLINELSKGANDIYTFLADEETVIESKASPEQLSEEISKAKQIIDSGEELRKYTGASTKEDGTRYETWEELIVDAENYAFFNGAIRFLCSDENGNDNWSHFDEKWKNAQRYFLKVPNPKGSAMNEGFRNANLLKALISRFTPDNFWKVLWWNHKTFNNRPHSWMHYLLNNEIHKPVHELLCGGEEVLELKPSTDFAANTLYLLSNTKLLDFVREKLPDSWIRNYHEHRAIYPSSTGVFLNAGVRNKLLLNTTGITVNNSHIIPGTDLLFGSDIQFKYTKDDTAYTFRWQHWNWIDMYEGEHRIHKDNDPTTHAFEFDGKEVTKSADFPGKIEQCIARYLDAKAQIDKAN